MSNIITNSARCKKCRTIIASAHVHDMQWCKCGAIAVDGGHQYLKRSGRPEDCEELSVTRALSIKTHRGTPQVVRSKS